MADITTNVVNFFSCVFNPIGCISNWSSPQAEDPLTRIVTETLSASSPVNTEGQRLVTESLTGWAEWQTALAVTGCVVLALGAAFVARRYCKCQGTVQQPKTPKVANKEIVPETPATTKQDPKTIFLRTATSLEEKLTTPDQKGMLSVLMAAYFLSADEFGEAKKKANSGRAIKGLSDGVKEDLTILITRAQTSSTSSSSRKRLTFEGDLLSPTSPTSGPPSKKGSAQPKKGVRYSQEVLEAALEDEPLTSQSDEEEDVKTQLPPTSTIGVSSRKDQLDSLVAASGSIPASSITPQLPPPTTGAPPPPPSSGSLPPSSSGLMSSITRGVSLNPTGTAPPPPPPPKDPHLAAIEGGQQTLRRTDIPERPKLPPIDTTNPLGAALLTSTMSRRADIDPPPTPAEKRDVWK